MSENFQNWVERVAADRVAKPLEAGEVVKSSAGEPFGAVTFVKVAKDDFLAEVGKRGDYYIYHIYPAEKWLGCVALFHQYMVKAFQFIFKDVGVVETDWVEEMMSWAIRVSGWTNNVWGDELALRVLEVIEQNLKNYEFYDSVK